VKGCPVLSRIAAAIGILGYALSAGVADAQSVGRTPGTFAISQTGAATYTIPIFAPRGPNGLQPSIALVYNSQAPGSTTASGTAAAPVPTTAGRCVTAPKIGIWTLPFCVLSHATQQGALQASAGYLGVGWSVQGLSSIYRCNLTYAQDGAPAAVSLATSDAYCLDGQRLRLTSGTYGTAGSTYQTEIANFTNVTAYGTAGNGPAYFIVQAPNGTKYEYGNGGNSQVLATGTSTASTWMLNEVTDLYSNTMQISYTPATGTAVPYQISWTPSSHGSSSYEYVMQFNYETVPSGSPTPLAYVLAGTQVQNTNLLSSIAISYAGTAVKTYYLTYQQSPTTARDELTEVEECAGTGTGNCLYPTTVTYQSGSAGLGSATSLSSSSYTLTATAYDFSGAGRNDIALENSSGALYVAFSLTVL
jgi:hypothetical protein